MPHKSSSVPTPPLHEIYTTWTEALALPPTPRLSTLRRLTCSLLNKGILSEIELSRLFLDLSLTHAYLGEYVLASAGFERAANGDGHRAFAHFARGLSQAELGDWKEAELSWVRCLRVFEQGRIDELPYRSFQGVRPNRSPDGDVITRNIGLEEPWKLLLVNVEHNRFQAALKAGSTRRDIPRLKPEDKGPGLNGIPAGFRFGPDGWLSAKLEKAEASVFQPLEDIGKPYSAKTSPQSSESSPIMKSLPPLPRRPKAQAPARASKVWYVDEPTLRNTYIPEASPPNSTAYDSGSSPGQDSIHFSPSSPSAIPTTPLSAFYSDSYQPGTYTDIIDSTPPTPSAIPTTPLSAFYSDSYPLDSYAETSDSCSSDLDEAINTIDDSIEDIDETLAIWGLPPDQPVFASPESRDDFQAEEYEHEYDEDYDDYEGEDDVEEDDTTLFANYILGNMERPKFIENAAVRASQIVNNTTTNNDRNEEILLPRTFEGFGPRM